MICDNCNIFCINNECFECHHFDIGYISKNCILFSDHATYTNVTQYNTKKASKFVMAIAIAVVDSSYKDNIIPFPCYCCCHVYCCIYHHQHCSLNVITSVKTLSYWLELRLGLCVKVVKFANLLEWYVSFLCLSVTLMCLRPLRANVLYSKIERDREEHPTRIRSATSNSKTYR